MTELLKGFKIETEDLTVSKKLFLIIVINSHKFQIIKI